MYFALPEPESEGIKNKNTNTITNSQTEVTNENTNVAVSKNENVNTATNENVNTATNTDIQIDVTKDWKTYTSTKHGFSFRYPQDWSVTEAPVAYLGVNYDAVQVVNPESETTNPQFAVTAFPMKSDQTDPFANFTLSTNIVQSTATKSDIMIAGIYGKFFEGFPTLVPANAAFIDHNTVTFKLDQGNAEVWDEVLKTFTFTDKNVDLEPSNPIKSVTDISSLFPVIPAGGMQSVSLMGDTALIGGGKYLYSYNGETITDLTSQVMPPTTRQEPQFIGHLLNNGSYWFVVASQIGEATRIYKYDGTTWTNITEPMNTALPRTNNVGATGSWNGSYWLLAAHVGRLAKYDGQTFIDITSQIPNAASSPTLGWSAWNGSYFLQNILYGGSGKLFKYDGATFTEVTGIDPKNYGYGLGWNGKYWLLTGFNNQHLLKYDGTQITDLGFPQHQQASVAWARSIWLVGPNFFDGKTLDTTTPFNIGYRVNSVSVGTSYGLMLGQNGAVYRFDF